MVVLKSHGNVFGAKFTAAEKKALDIEIKKELADQTRSHETELDAMILWNLHEQFGFGYDRLFKFYSSFTKNIKELVKRYEMPESESFWLATKKLKDYGIDLEEWEKKVDFGT